MHFTDFQKTIIKLIANGKITNTASFLIEICRDKASTEAEFQSYVELINIYIVEGESTYSRPNILLPYSANETLGILYEFCSLLDILENNNLLIKQDGIRHRTHEQVECQIVVPKKEQEKDIAEISINDATAILRKIANLLIIPHYAELNEFITRSFKTVEEAELKNEKWHRKAQFWIALTIAFFTALFGFLTTAQNMKKDNSILIKNKQLSIDTVIVKTLPKIGMDNKNDSNVMYRSTTSNESNLHK
jgi:hypothetical protein